jgi:thiol:disulfide interchange protein DsbD
MSLQGNILDVFVAFGAGVLVSFTPCVYPILPITVATIAGANTQKTRLGGFLLSLVYVLGLAITYSSLAVIAGLTGKVFGVLQNSPWILIGVANIFLLFALVMLDVIPFPTLRLGGKQGKNRGVLSVLLMGIASGFIVGPCTAPVLGAVLLKIASQKDILFGGVLVLVFAFGMGTLLLLAGTFSGFLASLPRSGPWMVWIKRLIGAVLIIAAEFYLVRAGGLF